MDHSPQQMTTEQLKSFGWVTGVLIIGLVGGLLPWIWNQNILDWQKVTGPIGGTLILWAFIHADSLIYIYKPWMWLAEKIGWFNTRVIMLLLFYVIIFPIGIIMRLVGHDPMARHFNREASSYRIPKQPQSKDHMETPF